MNKYKYLLFDLDGTITDSCEGIYKCFEYALNHYGIEVEDLNSLRPIIGPPLKDCFMEMFGFDEDKAIEAVAKYRERYADVGIFENRVYDGVYEMFSALKNAGYFIALATSKPENYAKRILEHFDLDKYFDLVAGATIDGKISNKEDVLNKIMQTLDNPDVSKMVMIGDREFDLAGAQAFGMDAIGVLYGFGSLEELNKFPSVLLAETPADVVKYLI